MQVRAADISGEVSDTQQGLKGVAKQISPFSLWHGVVPETPQLLLPLGITAAWQLCPGVTGLQHTPLTGT